jgi:TatD DNase family protein
MVDAHCHLADEAFARDAADVVDRARAAGVDQALCAVSALDSGELERAGRLASLWPALRFTVGVHPHEAAKCADGDEAVRIVEGVLDGIPGARAVGEIGLDYWYDLSPRPVQREVFRAQLRLARERGLPVVVHSREAEEDTLEILQAEGGGPWRGMLHCFAARRAFAERALDLGLHLSFAGILTFPRAAEIQDVARSLAADRLLAETDSPYLAPVPWRGKRNEPARVMDVLAALARLREADPLELGTRIEANFRALFRP